MEQQIIKCAFCKGRGKNPNFGGTCSVCKGKGKNKVIGKYMTCGSCRGLGQKRGTTLTCYDCGGLGVVPDTRETFRKAREEIGEARKEMAGEIEELTADVVVVKRKDKQSLSSGKDKKDQWEEESFDSAQDKKGEEESSGKTHFCQCCGDKVNDSVAIKICFDCFGKVKELRGYKAL